MFSDLEISQAYFLRLLGVEWIKPHVEHLS